MSEAPSAEEIVGHDGYARRGHPHEAFAWLRREAPLMRFEHPVAGPFRAVVRHADVVSISRDPQRFEVSTLFGVEPEIPLAPIDYAREDLLSTNPPLHGAMRRVTSPRFTPRALERHEAAMEAIVERLLDDVGDGELDFVERIAMPLPLLAIARLLGLPEADAERLGRLSNETTGPTDLEYQRPEGARATLDRAEEELLSYLESALEERRSAPRDDLLTLIAQAGATLTPERQRWYAELLVIAGNETTRNAASGGLLALLEHPDQLEKLRANPDLLDTAVEEMLRWTTPVSHLIRIPTEDVEVAGVTVPRGEPVALFYASANRDEAVFEDAQSFRIDRRPNRHLAFGIGEHFCLGAGLARLELRVLFRALLARIDHVERTGEIERMRANQIVSIKHLPVRLHARSA
jgi:cholest-4-en-3-one 26-monooxygenase